MKKAIFYTYSPPDHTQKEVWLYRQLKESFSSLREQNSQIEVCLISFDRKNLILDKICREFSVSLKEMGSVENFFPNSNKFKIMNSYAYSHKWISLALSRKMNMDSILLVDADTWFFKDPDEIFEKYREDARGTPFLRTSALETRKTAIRDMCRQCENVFDVSHVRANLIRSSVFLMNQNILEEYCSHFNYFHDILWKLFFFMKQYLDKNHDISCEPYMDKIAHIGFYHLEELAAAVYLSHLKIKMHYFDSFDVWQGSDFFLYKSEDIPVMAHYTTRHTQNFFDWKKSKSYLFKQQQVRNSSSLTTWKTYS